MDEQSMKESARQLAVPTSNRVTYQDSKVLLFKNLKGSQESAASPDLMYSVDVASTPRVMKIAEKKSSGRVSSRNNTKK